MNKPSPGTWHFTNDHMGDGWRITTSGPYAKSPNYLADCYGPNAEANAKLIAAAPDLLHNCREAMQALSVVHDHFEAEGKTEMVHDLETEIKCLALVIAKATGGAG